MGTKEKTILIVATKQSQKKKKKKIPIVCDQTRTISVSY